MMLEIQALYNNVAGLIQLVGPPSSLSLSVSLSLSLSLLILIIARCIIIVVVNIRCVEFLFVSIVGSEKISYVSFADKIKIQSLYLKYCLKVAPSTGSIVCNRTECIYI